MEATDKHDHDGLVVDLVTASIEGQTIIEDISFDVSPGEIAVFVGPSGSGKTTLLNSIAGLTHVEHGNIWIAGLDVTSLPPSRRRVGMVFQEFALYPTKTVYGNIDFPLRMKGLPRSERRHRVVKLAEQLNLQTLLERRVHRLSGGERQRVALGRALIKDPRLFLLDEPMSNVDAGMQDDLRSLILEAQRELNIPAVYVTHDQVEAWRIADKIGVLKGGELLQFGTPSDLYTLPANRFVAEFISDVPMSFVSVEFLSVPSKQFILENWPKARTVGLRQDDAGVADSKDGLIDIDADSVAIPSRYSHSERFAETVVYVLSVGDGRFRAHAEARLDGANTGDSMTIRARAAHVYLFDSSGSLVKARQR